MLPLYITVGFFVAVGILWFISIMSRKEYEQD